MLLLKTVIEVLEVAGSVAGRKLSLVHGRSGPTLYMKEIIFNNNRSGHARLFEIAGWPERRLVQFTAPLPMLLRVTRRT